MNTPLVSLEVHGATAEIALANPPLNFVTIGMLSDLHRVVRKLASRADVRSVIVHSGTARAFCAGSDMKEFSALVADAAVRKILPEDHVLRLLAELPMPTIAAIDGPALGGGLELALSCDLRVAQVNATLGATESRIGGLAGSGTQRLARLIGPARALELLFTGTVITAVQALSWGLVNVVTKNTTALDGARELAAVINSRGPLSNRLAKTLVTTALDGPLDSGLSRAVMAQQKIFDSSDLLEGATAFLEKREPRFTGL